MLRTRERYSRVFTPHAHPSGANDRGDGNTDDVPVVFCVCVDDDDGGGLYGACHRLIFASRPERKTCRARAARVRPNARRRVQRDVDVVAAV